MSIEQRINLKFLVQLGKTPTETFNLLQEVYRDATMSRTRIFEWHKRFREGREDVEDDPKSGRPTTSRTNENVERVREKVRSDRCLTVRMIADELSMNSERVWRIITEDLGMRKVCAKMVPRLLNDGQKEKEFKARFNNHNQSFKYQRKSNANELSKAFWQAKDAEKKPRIKWSIVAHTAPYHPGAKSCNLCLKKKLTILQADTSSTLNKRMELNGKCRHMNKFKLCNFS